MASLLAMPYSWPPTFVNRLATNYTPPVSRTTCELFLLEGMLMAAKTFADFEAELKKCHTTDWVATYEGYGRLLEWGDHIAPDKDKAFEFGDGKKRSTLMLRDPGSDKELLRIWPDRPVWFVFTGRLIDRPHLAADREQIEKELLSRLADTVGRYLEVTSSGNTCKFPLLALASAETFAGFRDAMTWFIARIGPRRS